MPKGKGYGRKRKPSGKSRSAAETGMFGRRARPAGSRRSKSSGKKKNKRKR